MIICPNCHHKEVENAIFCSKCGSQLISSKRTTTKSITNTPSGSLSATGEEQNISVLEFETSDSEVKASLYLLDSGQTIDLKGNAEQTLGRKSEGQTILPDVDLSPYNAYNLGVSRLHVNIKTINERILVIDLGSANGTRVNGQKLTPHVEYPLCHGDILALGRFKFQIILKNRLIHDPDNSSPAK